ncbi:DUF1697 domain-containing protein [Dyadobacter sp. CY323]|uniref:DUF1697 domain-containing protein n=1 Tax=Dyadobacter sp. CY323 TaxID=2907302 RepID=UPI001F3C9152|nr:DUF1697 domain-containing protein [Dyadobacter sp. CY323]MCE6991733.1 DUF1697 domain-containing protein [Dyadobacter sp. CY323]
MARETYIAILRGINVSGSNMLKMPVLQKLLGDAGFEDVKTYIQSGNVIFNYKASETEKLARLIEKELNDQLKMTVPVIVLDLETVRKVFEHNPFLKSRNEENANLHVTFLSDSPDLEKVSKIETEKYLPDEFIFSGNAIYLFCPDGYGKTKLNNNFFENKLKQKATTRNWKTVTELVRLGEEVAKNA